MYEACDIILQEPSYLPLLQYTSYLKITFPLSLLYLTKHGIMTFQLLNVGKHAKLLNLVLMHFFNQAI
jgi:hypothetical protein